jgi:hypothetical protein
MRSDRPVAGQIGRQRLAICRRDRLRSKHENFTGCPGPDDVIGREIRAARERAILDVAVQPIDDSEDPLNTA